MSLPVHSPYRSAVPLHAYIFGCALALSATTQLRVGGVGPSEILLTITLIIACFALFRKGKGKQQYMPQLYFLIIFDVAILGLLAVQLSVIDQNAFDDWIRQGIFVLFPLCIPVLYYFAFGYEGLRKSLRVFSISCIILLLIPFALTQVGFVSVGPVQFLYSTRFTAWANNPNQTALLIGLAVPILYLLFIDGEVKRKLAIPLIVLGIPIGLSTGSDALLVCWISIAFVFSMQGRRTEKSRSRGREYFKLIFKILLFCLIFGAATFWLLANSQDLYSGAGAGMGTNQGAIRVALWRNAFEAFLDAPIIGHGHGHFSGLFSPYNGSEAHNFFFDWLASYGFVGMAAFLLFIFSIARDLFIQKQMIAFAILALLLTLSVFHFYGRHPVFWTVLFFVGVLARKGPHVNTSAGVT